MKKKLRIVFLGTPEFAVATLQAIIESGYDVVGVITAPDKPAGRGRKLTQSSVKHYALSQNLKILQPTNLKSDDFINELKDLKANVQVVVAFRMLPKVVWKMPELGTFNLHASLLPDYRGAAPINWAIINGERTTGVTTFFIDEKIDTGAIILQEKIAINDNDNAEDLHDKLKILGSQLVLKTLNAIEKENVKTILQTKSGNFKEAPKLHKENCRIDWTDTLENIFNKIRGLSPYPAAWTMLKNGDEELVMKIYDCQIEKINHDSNPGNVCIDDNVLKVSVPNGFVIIKELQLPGKRKMEVKSFLNGYKILKDAKVL